MRIFETLRGYQQTVVLRTAIELDIFTAIGEGATAAAEIAKQRGVSERGVRMLCDTLASDGFLMKNDGRYALAPESATFLDRRSPACIAGTAQFLASDQNITESLTLADCVRKGGTVLPGQGSVEPDNPFWVLFARAMAPLLVMPARIIAEKTAGAGPVKVLDIAAGHGIFGIEVAKRNPQADITALDWASVLEVAKENAEKAGVGARYHLKPGNAFDVDLGSDYDIVLIPNFLHHFGPAAIDGFLRRVHAALRPSGKAVTMEFCPNEDRIAPRTPVRFAITMLLDTIDGDAYTLREIEAMFRKAGFSSSRGEMLPTEQTVIVSEK